MKRGMICPDCGMDDWDYICGHIENYGEARIAWIV